MQAESLAGPGNMPSLDLVGRMLGDSWAKARVVNSNQKSRVLESLKGFLCKECIRGIPWEAEEETYHKSSGGAPVSSRLLGLTKGVLSSNATE